MQYFMSKGIIIHFVHSNGFLYKKNRKSILISGAPAKSRSDGIQTHDLCGNKTWKSIENYGKMKDREIR